jgi:hypothetical protein
MRSKNWRTTHDDRGEAARIGHPLAIAPPEKAFGGEPFGF